MFSPVRMTTHRFPWDPPLEIHVNELLYYFGVAPVCTNDPGSNAPTW